MPKDRSLTWYSAADSGLELLGPDYVWDEVDRLFRRREVTPFPYSEGEATEDRHLQTVLAAKDRSIFSEELHHAIQDWPSEYHFSRARHCLVRPLRIQSGDKVLELGCGCGAITRYLGEIGADVVAVEGSLARARVAAERCRELPNVRVVVDDLLQFETEERFEWVLLVGVLEYAALFSNREDPFQHYLRSVGRFLTSSGRLVVAIENQLGLKYFNGCNEDHLGIPFYGVQDLYDAKAPRTFSRLELIEQLTAVGFQHTYFYYPFPDYKLPAVVLSDEALIDSQFDAVDLLPRSTARDYAGSPYRGFDEALAFAALGKGGLLAELSNSFLVVAQRNAPDLVKPETLAFTFSTQRSAEFCVQTEFVRGDAEIQVSKQHLAEADSDRSLGIGDLRITNVLAKSIYRPGRQLLWNLLRARCRGGDLQAIVLSLRPWMEFLLRQARVPTERIHGEHPRLNDLASFMLPGNFLDCTPFNLLHRGDALEPIDLEWQCEQDIPLGWVVTRGVFHSMRTGLASANDPPSITPVIEGLAASVGLSVGELDLQSWLDQEIRFQRAVIGLQYEEATTLPASSGLRSFAGEITSLNRSLADRVDEINSLKEDIVYVRQVLANQEAENDSVKEELPGRIVEINSLTEYIAVARQALADREVELGRLNHALAEVRQQSQATADRLQNELCESKSSIERLQHELAEFRRRISQIEASIGWRIVSSLGSAFENHPQIRKFARRVIRFTWWTLTLQLGWRLRERQRLFRRRDAIAAADLFDAGWYLNQYPDVTDAGWDPALHYALFGATERRNPGPHFDAGWYVDHNPDVARAGANPLFHYLQHGMHEARPTRAVPAPLPVPAETSLETTRDYNRWVELYDTIREADRDAIHRHLETLRETPLISVVMPVYNPRPEFLRKAIDSVLSQLYPVWELCIADDASTIPEIRTILEDYSKRDRRIKVVYRAKNGHIAAASNSALELATGEFIALMDHDDEIPVHALYMVAVELNEHPEADLIYSDSDHLDVSGQRTNPHFKTDWNPELFYSQNMINHLGVYRRSLVCEAGGFREGFEGSQDYDLALRISLHSHAELIRHVPFVLYHWRISTQAETYSTRNMDNAVQAARRALNRLLKNAPKQPARRKMMWHHDHLIPRLVGPARLRTVFQQPVKDYFARSGEDVQITSSKVACWNRVVRPVAQPLPRVVLIVPTRDKVDLLRNCLEGLLHKTRYSNVNVLVVDNGSKEEETIQYLESLRSDDRVRVLRIEGQFNFSVPRES